MNELTVQVQQTPGVIKWNFEDLKKELAVQMDEYKAIVYTDENIRDAKKDVAALRKLDKAVDARRIEIKNKCLEPYQVIEEQAKELKALIGEPIKLIAEKVDDYEARRKAAKKEKIMQFMEQTFVDLPGDIRKRLMCKIYDTRWENAGTADKVYKEAIQAALIETQDALTLLKNVDEDFQEQVMMVYKIDLNLTGAMMKANELQQQKEMLIEKERQRQEQERIRREQEERRKAEEAARAQAEAQAAAQEPPKQEVEETKAEEPEIVQRTATVVQPEPEEVQEEQPKIYTCMVKMVGTAEQIQKALDYARYIGTKCEVQR